MLATATVTFWRWLTGRPGRLEFAQSADRTIEERRVWLRHGATLNVRCDEVSGDGEPAVSALVRDISRGGIQLISPRRFEPGTLLSIELPSAGGEKALTVLACVVRAQPHGDTEWAMGCRFSSELHEEQLTAFGAARARPSTPDPRGWMRFPCDARAFYQLVNGPAGIHRAARVLNIAVSGMALLVEEPIAAGELLSAELHDAKDQPILTILACVVHTQESAEGHILGCNFIRELSDADMHALMRDEK